MRNFFNPKKRPRRVLPISETAPWKLYGSQRANKDVKPLKTFSQEVNAKLYIYLGDITELQTDAIVNAANSSLLGGGGVDGAIHAAAGPALREECSKLGGCSSGDAKISKGHNLPAKHIIHTVGPRGKNPEVLQSAYSRCFELMLEHELKSIAFPCISTGVYGYPNEAAAEVAIETTRKFIEKNLEKVEAVIFCLFTNKDIEAYHNLLPVYFPLASGENVKEEAENISDKKSADIKDKVSESKRETDPSCGSNSENRGTDKEKLITKSKDSSEAEKETNNGARCQDVLAPFEQEQSDSLSQEQSELVSQERMSKVENIENVEEPMSQEPLVEQDDINEEPMSQESTLEKDDKMEEPMSQVSTVQGEKGEPTSQVDDSQE